MAITGSGTHCIHITSSTDAIASSTIMMVASVRWVGADTVGDTVVIVDGSTSANPFFTSISSSTSFVDGWVFSKGYSLAGLTFTTMASGAIDLYLE